MKAPCKVILPIKGSKWTFKLVNDKLYDKTHLNIDGDEDSSAITLPVQREVHFRKSDITLSIIRHELLHVLVNSSLIGSSALSCHQMEELCAEIIGEHCSDLILWSDLIMNNFLLGNSD